MKKIALLFLIIIVSSCKIKNKEEIHHDCTVTSCEAVPKVSVLDDISRKSYRVKTSCGERVFIVYHKYNIGDSVTLTEVIIKD
jgi:hypothetical protein